MCIGDMGTPLITYKRGMVITMEFIEQYLQDTVKRAGCIETSQVDEIEEIVDTGLEKTEENIQKIALEYLDEKGYARRVDNLERAKQHILESSQFCDTVRVRKKRSIERDLLEEFTDEDLTKLQEICRLEKLINIEEKLDKISNKQYEYAVEIVDDIYTEADNKGGSLTEFESFAMLLNRYAQAGWRAISITAREVKNDRKISMTGFSSQTKQVVVVFERAKN